MPDTGKHLQKKYEVTALNLPVEYTVRMKQMLGEEADAFFERYDRPPRRGLRVNPLKISASEFAARLPFSAEPVPWAENGFYYPPDVRPAQHPWYRAGLYYLQEPSAMTPADRLQVQPGERVLDLCAAPGGKATQLAGKLFGKQKFADRSLLVANEISNSRAKALLRNLELFGAPGCFVTNERADRLAAVFSLYFDKILVDAPCSGEGMFHRQPEVCSHWSADRVLEFAAIQRRLLEEALKMLRPGGMLMYSTCTFSAEENEGTVASFLTRHPEIELLDISPYEGFAPGRPEWLSYSRFEETYSEQAVAQLTKCVRIWPHRMDGEGHFLALMRRKHNLTGAEDRMQEQEGSVFSAAVQSSRQVKRGKKKSRNRKTEKPGPMPELFLNQFLDEMGITLSAGRIDCRRDRMYLIPELPEEVQGLQFLRSGVFLGEVRKERFIPAQPFAMLLRAEDCREECVVSFAADDSRIGAYLTGQTITTGPAESDGRQTPAGTEKNQPAVFEKGWKLVCVDGYGLGWAHFANGVLKNKYAASWRS